MDCKHCGQPVPENETLCPTCGTPVDAEEASADARADLPVAEEPTERADVDAPEAEPTDRRPAPPRPDWQPAWPPESPADDATLPPPRPVSARRAPRPAAAYPDAARPVPRPAPQTFAAPVADDFADPDDLSEPDYAPEASPYFRREPTQLEVALRRFPAYLRAVFRQPYTTVHTSLRRKDWLSPALLLLATVLLFMLCALGPATMRYRESGFYSNTNVLAPLLRGATLGLAYGKLLLGLLLGMLGGLGATLCYLCAVKHVPFSWALAVNQLSYTLLPLLVVSPVYLLLGLFTSVGASVALLLMLLLCALRQEAFLRVMLSDPAETSCYGRFACVGAAWLLIVLLWCLAV